MVFRESNELTRRSARYPPRARIASPVKTQPFFRSFLTPAAICAVVYVVAMATVLQLSLRTYVPGSLDPGDLTLANFIALLKPLYARVFLQHGVDLLSYRVRHVDRQLSVGLRAGPYPKPARQVSDFDHSHHATLPRRGRADLFLDNRFWQSRVCQFHAAGARPDRASLFNSCSRPLLSWLLWCMSRSRSW